MDAWTDLFAVFIHIANGEKPFSENMELPLNLAIIEAMSLDATLIKSYS